MSDWDEDEESEKIIMQQSFLKMEANLFDQGYKEGRAMGWDEGRKQGYQDGLKLGSQIGFELMQYQGLLRTNMLRTFELLDNKLAEKVNHTHNYSDEVVKEFMTFNDKTQENWEAKKIEKLDEINSLVEAKSLKSPQFAQLL